MSTAFEEEVRSRIAPVTAPLGGSSPAGSDLSYDPEFERISAEIQKLSTLSGGGVDWMLVVDDSTRMLAERSKDFRLAGWLVVAKAQRDGWRGVTEGLFALQALVDGFWDTMYPPLKRARARAGVLEWLWEALDKMLAPRAVTAADADAIKALEQLVSSLDERLGEKLGNMNPGVGRFRSVVREKVRALPAPPPPPPPPPPPAEVKKEEPVASPAPIASTNGAPPAAVAVAAPVAAAVPVLEAPAIPVGGSLDELREAASKWQEGLVALAKAARATNPADPWSYRLIRVATYLTEDEAPPLQEPPARTYVRPPSKADRSAYAGLFEESSWEALVEAAEDSIGGDLYWLDLHRYSAVALERLNRPAARDAVVRETIALVTRMPGLEKLHFSSGGIPFAAPETIEWLDRERARSGGGAVVAASAGNGAGPVLSPELSPELREALSGPRDGSDATIAKLLRAAERGDARSRFVGRLEAAKIALEKDRNEVARDVAELLLPEVTETLEAWEPLLAADALANCLLAFQKAGNGEQESVDGRESLLFRRLLKLDPEAALRLRGSS